MRNSVSYLRHRRHVRHYFAVIVNYHAVSRGTCEIAKSANAFCSIKQREYAVTFNFGQDREKAEKSTAIRYLSFYLLYIGKLFFFSYIFVKDRSVLKERVFCQPQLRIRLL